MNLNARTVHTLRFRIGPMFLAVLIMTAWNVAQGQDSSSAEVEKRAEALLAKMTLEEKITMIGGINDFYIRPLPRLHLPALRMSDGPMGVHDYGETTAYPAGIALAASWDADLASRVGVSMGRDARARGVHFILAPGMNIYRAPTNGRNFEYLGEDPYLASRMAVPLIEGIQSQGVIATAKHFVANNMEYGRLDHSSDVDERTLREIYLPAFEASVKEAKVGALMDAYNLVNGVYMTQNGYLNKTVAKKEWGFDGIMMSDWGATHDGVAAANNGLDLEMPSGLYMNLQTLGPAIQRGEVSVATIDDEVRRILRKAIEFGFYDREQNDITIPLYSQQANQVALEEARAGMVLLKNENNLLPLDRKKIKTIVVLGPDAYPAVPGGGGSSQTKPFRAVSFLEGISDNLGKDGRVLFMEDQSDLDDIVAHTQFAAPSDGQGLKAEYFDNGQLQGAPTLVRTDERIDFHWGNGSYRDGGPIDHFSVRWTGNFVPPAEDDYKFYVSADDGVRLFVDNVLVIDDWKAHGETLDTYGAHFEAGKPHAIRLEYFEDVGAATARFGIAAATRPIDEATKSLAARADVVILCMGFDPTKESEGFDRTFRLPAGQDAFIEQITAVNKNVVVVLTAGGNVDMTRWLEKVPALLHAWYPGQEGGTALAQILFGEYSPSGKLPVSFERRLEDGATFKSCHPQKGDKRVEYTEGVFLGYRHFDRAAVKPLFPFGFGLSYTRFQYSDLKITAARDGANTHNLAQVSFSVKNSGSREGAEIAELYVGDAHASVPRPVKELKGFAKVDLAPGETKQVRLTLDRRAFSFYDVKKHDWSAEPGEFSILVGGSSADIQLRGNFMLDAK